MNLLPKLFSMSRAASPDNSDEPPFRVADGPRFPQNQLLGLNPPEPRPQAANWDRGDVRAKVDRLEIALDQTREQLNAFMSFQGVPRPKPSEPWREAILRLHAAGATEVQIAEHATATSGEVDFVIKIDRLARSSDSLRS